MLTWGTRCWLEADEAETRRIERAVMLSPNLAVCEALLRGEHVPIERLDAGQLQKYGRRPS